LTRLLDISTPAQSLFAGRTLKSASASNVHLILKSLITVSAKRVTG